MAFPFLFEMYQMKYRRLTLEELGELEQEFVRFLASNSIVSEEWMTLKTAQPEKAERLIEIFSDIVFEKVISKIKFLEHRSPNDLKLFKCDEDLIQLIGIKVIGANSIDFTQKQTAEEMISKFRLAPQGSIKMFSAEKKYKNNDRSTELFQMMEDGCLISDGKLYEMMKGMRE